MREGENLVDRIDRQGPKAFVDFLDRSGKLMILHNRIRQYTGTFDSGSSALPPGRCFNGIAAFPFHIALPCHFETLYSPALQLAMETSMTGKPPVYRFLTKDEGDGRLRKVGAVWATAKADVFSVSIDLEGAGERINFMMVPNKQPVSDAWHGSPPKLKFLDVAQELTDRIVEMIESNNGKVPWKREWNPDECAGPQAPVNAFTGNIYHGMNSLWLGLDARAMISADPPWATFKQAADEHCHVKKGLKSVLGIFYKPIEFEIKRRKKGHARSRS
jgi:hypothetical protein